MSEDLHNAERPRGDDDRAILAAVSDGRLKRLVPVVVWQRGIDYFAEGRVKEMHRPARGEIEATVSGDTLYYVRIAARSDDASYECSCPAYGAQLCKHIVAVAMEVRERLRPVVATPALNPSLVRLLLQYAPAEAELGRFELSPTCRERLDRALSTAPNITLRECLRSPLDVAKRVPSNDLVRIVHSETAALRRAYAEERRELQAQEEEHALEAAVDHVTGSSGVRRFVALAAEAVIAARGKMTESERIRLEEARERTAVLRAGRVAKLELGIASVVLDSWRSGALVFGEARYEYERSQMASWITALLEQAIDIVATPSDERHAAVVAAIERDPEQALLEGLDDLLRAEPAEEKQRSVLAWRFTPGRGRIGLEAYEQKPTKNGYSAGSRTDRMVDRRRVALLPQDELVFGRLQQPAIDQLEALVGHPRVTPDEPPRLPHEVRNAKVAVRAVDAGEGRVLLVPTLDGVSLTIDNVLHAHSGEPEGAFAVDAETRRLLFARFNAFERGLVKHLTAAPALLPSTAVPALMERMVALEQRVPVSLGASLRGEKTEAARELVARFEAAGTQMRFQLLVEPMGDGLAFVPGRGQKEISRVIDGERRYTERDLDAELLDAERMWGELGLEPVPDFSTMALAPDAALALLDALRRRPELRVEWPKQTPRPAISALASLSQVQLTVKKKREWFRLDGKAQVDGDQVTLAAIALALRERRRYVMVGENKWLAIESQLAEQLKALEAIAVTAKDEEEDGLALTRASANAIAELQDAGAVVDAPRDFLALVDKMRAAKNTTHPVPAGLTATLRPYQLAGFQWLARLGDWGIGGCLADDMGLGKTVQAVALLLHRSALGPALVVAPTSVGFNWRRELERFAPSLTVVDARAGLPLKLEAGHVVVTSYGLMTREVEAFSAQHFATVIYDEAHALKNATAQRTKAARKIGGSLCVALTGTPIENRLSELWSLFHIVAPGLLGDAETFRSRFVLPIEQDRNDNAKALLGKIVAPFLLRRTKTLVAPELPEKTETAIAVEMPPEERALYETLREEKLRALQRQRSELTGQRARIAILAALMELRLCACHPRLIDPESAIAGSKLMALVRILEELKESGHRALVFSQFTRFLDVIEDALSERGFGVQRLDGATSPAERARRVDAFEQGTGDVFLLSLQAGAVGINLTSADYVILVDPWWNPAVEDQAAGRAHRIGQKKPVTVYRLFCRGTLEEKILEMHADKRELVAAVMDNAAAAPAAMSGEELLALLDEGDGAV